MPEPLPPDDLPAPAAPGSSVEALPARRGSARVAFTSGTVSRRLLGATLLVAILVSGAVWLDDRRARQELRADIARRLTAIDNISQANARAESQLGGDLREAQAKIALLEARLAESQQQQASLEALYRDLAPSRDEIALTEIEQILIIASQQLQLAGNVQAALAALQLGEGKLQRMERPQFLPLRRALARDIERLKAVPFVDVSGMSVKLDQAVAGIDKLPLARDERLPPPSADNAAPRQETAWSRLLRDVWDELRQLVRIEVSERPAAALLPPTQEYFLRENLKLRLLSARVALLNHEDEAFKADVLAAEAWLRQYFDTRTKAVQTLQASLRQLAATPTAGDVPDLARTLDAMRVLRAASDRTPSRAASGERPSR